MKLHRARVALWAFAILGLAGCGAGGPQRVRVEVTEAGFTPPSVHVQKGRAVTITFERTVDKTCATDVVFSSLHRGYDLPLHKPVTVKLAAAEIGDSLRFNCSMNMVHGMLVAR